MDLVYLTNKISPTFWGIVVGSLFTIIGVILTNASNIKRLRIQQDYDRAMKTREQDLAMRKEVYLAAMEAIAAGMGAIGTFGDMNISQQQLMESYNSKSPAIAKVSIIGRDETIKAIVEFNQSLIAAFMRLGSMRSKMEILQLRLAGVVEQIEQAKQERYRLATQLKTIEITEEPDSRPWQITQKLLEQENRRITELDEQHGQIENELYPLLMVLVEKSVSEIAALDGKSVNVIRLIREELELPFDDAQYLEVIRSSHENLKNSLQAFQDDWSEGEEPGAQAGTP
jgi:hypothetical protein